MAFPVLPLQNLIRRETNRVLETRTKKFGGMVEEASTEQPNPHKRSWDANYILLNLAQKTIVKDFLIPLGSTKFFVFTDRCGGTDYDVRMVKDSLTIARKGALFVVSFKISH